MLLFFKLSNTYIIGFVSLGDIESVIFKKAFSEIFTIHIFGDF